VFLESLQEIDREEFEEMCVILTEKVYDRQLSEILVGISMGDEDFRNQYQQNGYGFKNDIDQEVVYQFPTLVMVGKQDSIVGYKDAFKFADIYASSTFVALESAGHSLHIEQEELFNLHTRVWLRRIK
jgi:pimeloyl-ACP methyl ester carboxylesterase